MGGPLRRRLGLACLVALLALVVLAPAAAAQGARPTANFRFAPANPTTGQVVQFTDLSTDPDDDLASRHWDFGDGATSDAQDPQHSFARSGQYMVNLTVTDAAGNQASRERTVGVAGRPPVASIEIVAPKRPHPGEEIHFRSAGDDPDGTVVNWTWEFGDGARAYEAGPIHTFPRAGAYDVNLTVTDDEGMTNHTSLKLAVETGPGGLFASIPTWIYGTFPFLAALCLLGLAVLVLRAGQPIIYNRVFFLLYATSALKSVTDGYFALVGFDRGKPLVPLVELLNVVSAYFLISVFVWFVLVFPRPVLPWLKDGRRGAVSLALAAPFLYVYFFTRVDATNFFNVYASLLALACLGLLIYHAWETDSLEERHRIRLLAFTFFLVVLSTILVTVVQIAQTRAEAAGDVGRAQYYLGIVFFVYFIVAPILELVGSTILMYAILRYQLLGIEVFVKKVTRGAIFAITIGVVFVIVSNTIEQVFQVTVLRGVRFDFLIAGFISAGLMYPVQKGTERVANRIFPEAGSRSLEYLSRRRMEIYETQLRYALLDGVLKQKERAMLTKLKESLHMTFDEVKRVAARFPQVRPEDLWPRPPPAAPAPRPIRR